MLMRGVGDVVHVGPARGPNEKFSIKVLSYFCSIFPYHLGPFTKGTFVQTNTYNLICSNFLAETFIREKILLPEFACCCCLSENNNWRFLIPKITHT